VQDAIRKAHLAFKVVVLLLFGVLLADKVIASLRRVEVGEIAIILLVCAWDDGEDKTKMGKRNKQPCYLEERRPETA
jgi:hypothetical protein